MDNTIIYQKIEQIAKALVKENSRFVRADLAFELKDVGIDKDSLLVSQLIWEAYNYFSQSDAIKKAFFNNEKTISIVEEYLPYALAQKENKDTLIDCIQKSLKESRQTLSVLNNELSTDLSIIEENTDFDLVNKITGTQGITNIQTNAQRLFDGYSRLIDIYSNARSEVKETMVDFVILRKDVEQIYSEYAQKLIDIYGDRIKSVAPDIFDFDQVEFLEVEKMLENIRLEYDQLSEKCAILISSISGNFKKAIMESGKSYQSNRSRGIGLMLAGINMLEHYMDANEKTARSKQELEILKTDIKRDCSTIKSDYARLATIYKTLNDLYIPKANIFYKYSKEVFSDELKELFEILYQDPKIKDLVEKREKAKEKLRNTESTLIDNQLNISYYSDSVKKSQDFLKTKTDEYETALRRKPNKPFFLWNFITFGSAGRSYNRDLYEWKNTCAPVINEFERYKVDMSLDNDELVKHKSEREKYTIENQELKKEIRRLSSAISSKIQVSEELKVKMIPHLEAIVKLLRIGKEIAESKLEQRHIRAVKIEKVEVKELPSEIQKNITSLSADLKNNMLVDTNFAKQSVGKLNEFIAEEFYLEPHTENVSEEDALKLAAAQNAAIEKGVALFEAWESLKESQRQGQLTREKYDKAEKKLQKEFQDDMEKIDNQSDTLRSVMKRINASTDSETIKEGLIALSGKSKIMSENEIEDFLNNNKTLII